MVNVDQARDLPDRGSVTPQLIGMDDLWNVVFSQKSDQEDLCRFDIAVPLKQEIEYETALVDPPPSQCRTPSTVVQTLSRYHREPRRVPGGATLQ